MRDYFDGSAYEKELLPCPFCGEDKRDLPYVRRENEKHIGIVYTVSCSNCGCEPSGCVETVEEAITFWNTRKLSDKNIDFMNGFNEAKDIFKKLINNLQVIKK